MNITVTSIEDMDGFSRIAAEVKKGKQSTLIAFFAYPDMDRPAILAKAQAIADSQLTIKQPVVHSRGQGVKDLEKDVGKPITI